MLLLCFFYCGIPFRSLSHGVVSLVLPSRCCSYFSSALIVCHGDNLPLSPGKAAQLCAAYIVSEFSQLRFVFLFFLLEQVLQQVFHHRIFLYISLSLSVVFCFSKVFLECITFHLLTAKSTEHSLCSFSLRQLFSFRCQVFLLERQRQR